MTQHHNISGSEAFAPRPHVIVRRIRKARRSVHPAVMLFAIAAALGVIASLLDSWIGAPIFLGLVSIGFLILWVWPSH